MNQTIKISLITVCYNSEKTIKKTIESVLNQNYANIEYIIIDGGSKDGTLNIINEFSIGIDKLISESDKGIYDAINKGILLATGEIVGILNSDDIFYDQNTLSDIVAQFNSNRDLDAVIGDIIFLNDEGKTHRYYSSKNWTPSNFAWGIMPPHPTFYCKRQNFFKFGLYRLDFKIAADYELLIRFLYVNKLNYKYISKILVKMSLGGISTKNILSNFQINREVLRACEINNINTNVFKLYTKYIFKIKELIKFE
jgi:glycosyltransferase involved in cell wall biosynthesis